VPPLPADIDLTRETLIVATSGVKPSSGFVVLIQSVTESDEIHVSLLETIPGPQCPRMTELTYPDAFALIPKTSKPIRFDITTATVDCSIRRSISGKQPSMSDAYSSFVTPPMYGPSTPGTTMLPSAC
jgi:hypothetical protein